MTRVKICGLTNLDDALCAADAGASLLGFILYARSPRYIEQSHVRDIVSRMREEYPDILMVGVFVNESPEHISGVLSAASLDYAQLSGDEPPASVAALHGRAYKAVRTTEEARHYIGVSAGQSSFLPELLLDAKHPVLYGGSGLRADESLAHTLACEVRLLLAGGLNPDIVTDAIQQIKPWGVDVSSGVEVSPGRKDHQRIRAFMAAVRSASQCE